MARHRTIEQQLTHAVRQSHTTGTSKRYEKKTNPEWQELGKSWSHQTMQNRLELAHAFGKFMKTEFPEIKLVRDLKAEHYNAYLEKNKERWSSATLQRYMSDFRAIQREVEHCYANIPKMDVRHEIRAYKPSNEQMAMRTSNAMEKADFDKLTECTNVNLKNALTLAYTFGLRSEGICTIKAEDITEKDGKVYATVTEKGGRTRTVEALTEEMGKYVKENLADARTGRICETQPESLRRALQREMKKTGMADKYRGEKFHKIRKLYAQELYDKHRQEHSKRESIQYVNVALGHSADRDTDLLACYVSNIW